MQEKEPLNLILLGRSGSGKGTQARLLVDEFNLEYIGTGDLLRAYSQRDNPLAHRLKETLAQGKLTPSWMPFFIWMEKLAYIDPRKGVLFDGSPRMLDEAKILDEVLAWFSRGNVKVILIDTPRDIAEQRLMKRRACGICGKGAYYEKDAEKEVIRCHYCGGNIIMRAEDNPAGIHARLDWFDKEVVPVLSHYRERGMLITADGRKTPPEAHKEILAKLKSE